jgi:DNA-binding transcriptional ArsR family regulator
MSPQAPTPAARPQVRVLDLTAPQRVARIEVGVSPAYELIAALQALSNPSGWPTYDQGAAWFDERRSAMSDSLRRELEQLPIEWGHLAGLIAEAPQRDDVAAVIDHLAGLPPAVIYRSLIESHLHGAARREHADLVDAAVDGDRAAGARLLEFAADDCAEDSARLIEAVLDFDASDLRDRIIAALREAATLLADHIAAVTPVLRHDADVRRERIRGLPLEDAVEAGTDGVHYTLEPGVRRVLMVPQVAMRPWVLISEYGDTKVFMVAVSEERLSADLDTPPARLLQVIKALAEEQRLRILRRLAASGSASLQEIADHIGVAKSTAHHHMVQLRAAGLTVVDLGADRDYRIRDGVGDDVRQLLDTYLRGGAR